MKLLLKKTLPEHILERERKSSKICFLFFSPDLYKDTFIRSRKYLCVTFLEILYAFWVFVHSSKYTWVSQKFCYIRRLQMSLSKSFFVEVDSDWTVKYQVFIICNFLNLLRHLCYLLTSHINLKRKIIFAQNIYIIDRISTQKSNSINSFDNSQKIPLKFFFDIIQFNHKIFYSPGVFMLVRLFVPKMYYSTCKKSNWLINLLFEICLKNNFPNRAKILWNIYHNKKFH